MNLAALCPVQTGSGACWLRRSCIVSRESQFRRRHQRPNARTGDPQNHQQSGLQPDDGGLDTPYTVRRAMAHCQHGARIRRKRNQDRGNEVIPIRNINTRLC